MMSSTHPSPGSPILVRVDADLRTLIPGYLEHRRKDVQTIRDAVTREDYKTIQTLGHRMKGEGSGYGFDAISEIGTVLEKAAKDGNGNEIRKTLLELTTFLDRVTVVYD